MSAARRAWFYGSLITLAACAARTGVERKQSVASMSPFRSLSRDGGAPSQASDASARSAPTQTATATAGNTFFSAPWRAYLFERSADNAVRRGVEADGTYYATLSGLRVRVRSGTFSWSPDIVLGGIAIASRVRDGWLFAGWDGALYRAPYFTAPLERIGSTDARPLETGFVSTGRITAMDKQGQLWIGAHDGFRRWNAPEGTLLLDAGFADENFGIAAVSPGRLYRTTDGGARWDLLDTGGLGAFEVLPESDSFVVRGAGGQFRIGAQGAPTPFTGIALGSDAQVTEQAALRLSASNEGPGARALQLAQGAIVLPPDRVYYTTNTYRPPNDRFGALVRPAGYVTDELWVATPGQAPTRIEPPGAQCRYFPWRDRIFAVCRDMSTYRAALFSGDGLSSWTSINAAVSMPLWGAFATSSDGRSAWSFSACDNSPHGSNVHWCRYDGARWANVEIERRASFVAAWGDHIAYRISQGVFEQSVPGPLRVQSVSAMPETARPPRRSNPRARIESGAFTQDGTFYSRATIDEDYALAIGQIDQELAVRPLPEGAKDVAMADANRGLAVGERLDRVWSTDDGGRTWRPLALPLQGDSRGILVPTEVGDSEVRVRCSSFACIVADRLVWTSEALIGEPPPIVRSAPRVQPAETPTEVAARPRPPAREIEFGSVRCAADPPPSTDGYYFNAGAWLHNAQGPQNTWEWGGYDSRGAFRARSRGALPPLDAPSDWSPTVFSFSPRFASRSLAIVERCSFTSSYGGGARPKQCDLVALSPNRAPQTFLALRPFIAARTPVSTPRVAEVIALPDGTLGVRVASGPFDDGPSLTSSIAATEPRVDVVLRINDEGTVLEHKGFAWARQETRMRALAFDGNSLGILVLRRNSRELRFYRDASDNGRVLAPAPLRLQPCGTDAQPNTPFFVTSANDHNLAIRAGAAISGLSLFRGEDSVQTRVDLTSSGVCIRRVTAGTSAYSSITATYAATQLGGALVLDAVNGAFRGTAVTSARRAPVDCVPDVVNR